MSLTISSQLLLLRLSLSLSLSLSPPFVCFPLPPHTFCESVSVTALAALHSSPAAFVPLPDLAEWAERTPTNLSVCPSVCRHILIHNVELAALTKYGVCK